ncbi:MAG TPA: hypothetical protein VMT64_15515 [Candidatus Binataceae bacterium]|nr:hypothetical protein [Candidatus Binataceae bacterium]
MKKLLMTAVMLAFASTATLAATQVATTPDSDAINAARQAKYDKLLHDHPKTEPIANPDLKVQVTTDRIIRSCCRPPDLVVGGKVTNASKEPIDYVRLLFAFEDEDGKVLHAESTYNHNAVSMADDEEMERILKEKPHFTPLKPGDTDTFSMVVPTIVLPRYNKVELFSNDTRP